MPQIDNIVSVLTTRNTVFPTKEGFSRPVLMGYHNFFPEPYRKYSDLDEMEDDGFPTHHAMYRMASALANQSPRPVDWIVGRLGSAHTHTVTLTMLSAVEGQFIRFKIARPTDGTVVEIEYEIPAAATTTTVATAVELLVEAVAGVDASAAVAVVTAVPTTPGNVLFFYDLENVALRDTTADAAYDTALSTLEDATTDEDSWYYILLDVASEANVDDVATWTESRKKAFFPLIVDTIEKTGTGTVGSGLVTGAYDRTVPMFHEHLHEYANAAWVGRCSPQNPGAVNWNLKDIAGITPSQLTTTQMSNLDTRGLNYFMRIKGLRLTQGGGQASSGEYFDIIHGTDWTEEELQVETLAYMVSAEKRGYTDVTKDELEALGYAVMRRGSTSDRPIFVESSISVIAPAVATITPTQKSTREYGNIKIKATFQGAVNKVTYALTLSL